MQKCCVAQKSLKKSLTPVVLPEVINDIPEQFIIPVMAQWSHGDSGQLVAAETNRTFRSADTGCQTTANRSSWIWEEIVVCRARRSSSVWSKARWSNLLGLL